MPKVKEIDAKDLNIQGTLNTGDAKKLLEKERAARIEICTKELQAVLEKHKCFIDAAILVSPRGNEPVVRILSKE